MVPQGGFEPPTSPLPRGYSTPELLRRKSKKEIYNDLRSTRKMDNLSLFTYKSLSLQLFEFLCFVGALAWWSKRL